jgi:SAM-dependent methyltransferase
MRTSSCSICYLCGSTGEIIYQDLEDLLFGVPGRWSFRRCDSPECGLVWLDPMPLEDDIGLAYQAYYTHDDNQVVTPRTPLHFIYHLLLQMTPLHGERQQLDLMFLQKTQSGRLLEVGCGSGQHLARIRTLGWDVEGQEVDTRAAGQARDNYSLTIHTGKLADLGLADSTYDVVIMRHVIEHLHHPVAVLNECHRILKPSGKLIAVTPNVESCGHRHYGSCWRGLEPPRHLYLFSGKTLPALAVRSGFSCTRVWTVAGNAQTIAAASEALQRGGWDKLSRLAKLRMSVAGVIFQMRALVFHAAHRDSGEECILQATK